jgi:hypothetical protein
VNDTHEHPLICRIDLYDSDDGQNRTYSFGDIYGSISFMSHFTNSDELDWQFDI